MQTKPAKRSSRTTSFPRPRGGTLEMTTTVRAFSAGLTNTKPSLVAFPSPDPRLLHPDMRAWAKLCREICDWWRDSWRNQPLREKSRRVALRGTLGWENWGIGKLGMAKTRALHVVIIEERRKLLVTRAPSLHRSTLKGTTFVSLFLFCFFHHVGLFVPCPCGVFGHCGSRQMYSVQVMYGAVGESVPVKRRCGRGQQRQALPWLVLNSPGRRGCPQQNQHLPTDALCLSWHLR